jgi:hypothetical protein
LVVGAAKEIVEVTTADGLLNPSAKQGSYEQLPRVISQTSFPSPRKNIAEVDVEEDTIKTFFQFGGALRELEHSPGESFLASVNKATRPAVRTKAFSTSGGLALDGLTLVLGVDIAARLNVTQDVAVTFASIGGGTLTDEQIAAQINNAVGEDVASIVIEGSNSRVQIASLLWGVSASITVRAGGSANLLLGFASKDVEYRVEGSGFRAQDQNNNTTLSPWVEWSKGAYLKDGVVQNALETYVNGSAAFGFVDATGSFGTFQASGLTFTGNGSIDVKVGDEFYANGVKPNGAVVMKVEATRFKLGTINAKLSVYDTNGKLVSAVYDESKVSTVYAGVPFSPRYGWFMAKNLKTSTVPTAAVLAGTTIGSDATTGTVEAPGAGTYPVSLTGLTLRVDLVVNGVEVDTQVMTFSGPSFANVADVVTALNGMTHTGFFAHTDQGGTKLALSTNITGAHQQLLLQGSSTALTALGFVAGTNYTGLGKDSEFVDITATLLGGTQNFPFTPTGTLVVERSSDGGLTWTAGSKTFTFPDSTPIATITDLVTALNTASSWDGTTLPTDFAISNVGNKLKLTSVGKGSLVGLRIGSSSTGIGVAAATTLLFTGGAYDLGEENLNGLTLKFKLNDRSKVYSVLFSSDSLPDAVAAINEAVSWPVASVNGAGTSLVLTSTIKGYASKIEVVTDAGSVKANAALGFSVQGSSSFGSGRPNPDFYLDVSGNVVLNGEILRSQLTGSPFSPGVSDIYIQYRGLRKDVSPVAKNPGMLRISDLATLQTVLSPLRSDNPLGLGMYFQLINAPTLQCAGLGVDEISAGSPYGTSAAFARAANLIEAEEVYAIAPLTDDETVHQIFKTHVETMSAPEQKGERIVITCPSVPLRAVDDVVSSGLSGNSTATENEFVLDANPNAGLVSRGLEPLELSYRDQVFLETTVESELRRYLVTAVNGTLVTVTQTFTIGQNADSFYSLTPLNVSVINADWSLKVRGDELLIPGSTLPDKDLTADTVQTRASTFKQRRMLYVFPDMVKASISGTEELLPGFYACAAIAGMTAKYPPQQGFTNLPMTGFTGVVGSNDTYSPKQLNVMAAGGAYILVQEAPGAPLISRHQLTTDLTQIETREYSITKVIDYCAKFLRVGLRKFIGTFNITTPFLDTLSSVIQGMLGFLAEAGVILGGDLNNLAQDSTAPDTVLVDVTLNVPFPCNYIRLTISI